MDFDSRFGHRITRCEDRIKHTFINKLLAAESLNNAGPSASVYFDNKVQKTLSKNDRLAVYGDSIATTMLCRDWYHKNTTVWTLIRNEALCNDSLAKIGFSHGLDVCVNKDAGTLSVSNKMMATAVEAILGAVHLDGGDAALHHVLTQLRIVNPHTLLVLFETAVKSLFCGAAEPAIRLISPTAAYSTTKQDRVIFWLTDIAELYFVTRSAPANVLQMYRGAYSALQNRTSRPFEPGPLSVHGKTTSVN